MCSTDIITGLEITFHVAALFLAEMITSENFPKKGGVFYLIEDSDYQNEKYRSKDMTTEIRLVKKHLSNLLEMFECSGDTDRHHVCRDSRKYKHG